MKKIFIAAAALVIGLSFAAHAADEQVDASQPNERTHSVGDKRDHSIEWKNMTDAEKKAHKAARKKQWEKMTPDQREAAKVKWRTERMGGTNKGKIQ